MNAARLTVIGSLLLTASFALAGDAKVVEDKVLDIGGAAQGAAVRPINVACLSPDGKYLLYVKAEAAGAKPEGYNGPWSGRVYRLFLRDLATGKDAAIPAPGWVWDDPLQLMLAQNVFGADGKKIVLGIGATATEGGIFRDREGTMKPAVYDIATGKLETLPVEGKIVFPSFHRNGKDLLIAVLAKEEPPKELIVTPADKFEPRKVPIGGIPFAMCPAADVVPVLEFPARDPAAEKTAFKLHLQDLAAGKTVADLPVSERNNSLDELPPRWTADGRFLYYIDLLADKPLEGGPPRSKLITRIWDRKEGKEAGVVDNAIPVGPGRGDSEMVMLCKEGKTRPALHDAATGKTTDLLPAETGVTPLCASGGRIVYAKAVGEGKVEYHLAKIE